MADEPLIAVFVDFENLAIGARQSKQGRVQIDLILKRLLEKGRIVYKRAYCDWSGYRKEAVELHKAGVEMVDIPQTKMSGKNSADIHMVVDALDLCYAKQHIDIFALLSGDSDFSPLVAKLKENDKRVITCGVKSSTSDLLVAASDEFIYYDDLVRTAAKSSAARRPATKSGGAGGSRKPAAAGLDEGPARVLEIVRSLDRDYDQIWGSMVKQTVRRVYPGFSEDYYGFGSIAEMLELLEDKKLVDLEYDEKRGNYLVRVHSEKRG